MDGVFEAVIARFDMRPNCGESPSIDTVPEDRPAGVGFWVNAMTVRDARRIVDPRPALRSVDRPVLVLRGQCDYQRWEGTREYRDVFPNAVLLFHR